MKLQIRLEKTIEHTRPPMSLRGTVQEALPVQFQDVFIMEPAPGCARIRVCISRLVIEGSLRSADGCLVGYLPCDTQTAEFEVEAKHVQRTRRRFYNPRLRV